MPETLSNLGLDESEAKIYEALLELGPATVSQITRKAGITRTLGYHVLEKLGWKGLVDRASGKQKKIIYTAEHPQRLVQFVKSQRSMWDRRISQVESKLPELVALFRVAEKPVVRYQEGVEGVKNIYSETLEAKSEILSIADIDGWINQESLYRWGLDYNRERSRRKIHERLLLLDTPPGRRWAAHNPGLPKFTHIRWIKLEMLPWLKEFGGEINIYENKVMMVLLKKPNLMGIMIENSALASILKGLFELAWTVATPIKKRKA